MTLIKSWPSKLLILPKRLLHKPTRDDVVIPIIAKLLNIKILGRKEFLQSNKSCRIFPFGSEEAIAPAKPYHLGEVPPAISCVVGHFTICQSFVVEVQNTQLVGNLAIGFNSDGDLITETTLPPTTDLRPRIEGGIPIETLFLSKSPSKSAQLSTVCSLVNYWSQNYYHWLIDCLARLELVEYYQEQTGCKPQLIIGANPKQWQIDSLRLLGYDAGSCIHWNADQVNVERLIIPSFRRQGERVSPHSLKWLRERILSNLPPVEKQALTYSSRIYVSRANASGRRVMNEDEVLQKLAPLGFISYRLEELSFVEQVRLFSTAEMVIAPHGAGLTNIIFAPAGASVIEFDISQISPGFFIFSAILGFNHGCLLCQQPQFERFRRTRGDMVVDINQLEILIGEMEKACPKLGYNPMNVKE